MLAKLIKYDLKFGKSTFLSIAVGLILGSFILKMVEVEYFGGMAISAFILLFAVPCAVVCIVLVFQNYNKCIFGDQGYLMLTLPVKRSQLLLSQTITSLLWFNVMIAAGAMMIFNVSNANIATLLSGLSIATIQYFLIPLTLSNILALFAITFLFLVISFANISIQGKRLPFLLSGLISFICLTLEIKIIGDLFPRIMGACVLNYRQEGNRLVMWISRNGTPGGSSVDLVLIGGLLAFTAIHFGLNIYLLNHKVDLK